MAYLYYDGTKYYAIKSVDECWELYDNQHCFEVDELMVNAVAMLCNKGYITEQCCSGHYVSEVYCLVEPEYDINNGDYICERYSEEIGCNCRYFINDGFNPGAFVIFNKEYRWDVLPDGWKYSNRRLSTLDFNCDSPAEYYYEISRLILNLEKWIMEKL